LEHSSILHSMYRWLTLQSAFTSRGAPQP